MKKLKIRKKKVSADVALAGRANHCENVLQLGLKVSRRGGDDEVSVGAPPTARLVQQVLSQWLAVWCADLAMMSCMR